MAEPLIPKSIKLLDNAATLLKKGTDAEMLAFTMLSEARGEGLDGMEAVAHTILNRVDSKRYNFKSQNSVRDVLKQKTKGGLYEYNGLQGQIGTHTPFSDTKQYIKNNPEDYKKVLNLANKLLNMPNEKRQQYDITYGSTFFQNPNSSTDTFISKKAKTGEFENATTIGEHDFYAIKGDYRLTSIPVKDMPIPKPKPNLPVSKTGELTSAGKSDNIDEALLAAKTRSDTLLPEKEVDKQTQDILDASAFTDTEINMNEGGMAKSIDEQMELFAEGGLYEEGGMLDDESGNEVPPGSLKEEVRDDIPANLSEGEFVFPADVVRYWGLDTLMRMRQKAKAGLKRMEAMGQMGNADEATMPDDLPFDINDLELEDEQEELNFQTGGLATNPLTQNAMGNFMGSAGTDPNQMYGPMYTPLGYPSTQQTPEASATAPMEAASARYMQPSQYAYQTPSFTYTPEKDVMPTFRETTGMGVPGIDYETLTYVNDAGDTIIMYKDKKTGKLYNETFQEASVPEGYKLQTEVKPEEVTTETAKVAETGGGRDDDEETTGATAAFGGEVDPKTGRVSGGYKGNISYFTAGYQPGKMFSGIKGVPGMARRLGASGLSQITGGKLGTQMSLQPGEFVEISGLQEIRAPGVYGKNPTLVNARLRLDATTYNSLYGSSKTVSGRKELKTVVDFVRNKYGAKALADPSKVIDVGIERADLNNRNAVSRAVDELEGKGEMNADVAREVRENNKIGNVSMVGGRPTITNPFEANRVRGGMTEAEVQAANERARAAQEQRDRDAQAQRDRDAAAAAARAAALDAEDRDNGRDDDGGFSGSEGFGRGDDAAAPICLTEDMKVKLNGVIDFVTNVKVGDIVDNTVVTEVLHKHMREGYYVVNGELKITNDHPVLANGSWKRTEDLVLGDYINKVEVTSLEYVEQVTPTVYIGTADDRYNVYTEGEVYTVHGQYKNGLKKAA